MQGKKTVCEKPENLKGKPADCTPAQIRKCHGTVKKHPVEPELHTMELKDRLQERVMERGVRRSGHSRNRLPMLSSGRSR